MPMSWMTYEEELQEAKRIAERQAKRSILIEEEKLKAQYSMLEAQDAVLEAQDAVILAQEDVAEARENLFSAYEVAIEECRIRAIQSIMDNLHLTYEEACKALGYDEKVYRYQFRT